MAVTPAKRNHFYDFPVDARYLQVVRHPAVGGDVPGLHALPGTGQPGGDAAGDQRRAPGAS